MSYDAYQKNILGYLIDVGGRALRVEVERDLKIPKASMSDVLRKMESGGLVKIHQTFGNKTYLEITFEGKSFYQYGIDGPQEYDLPLYIKEYLAKKSGFSGFRPIQEEFVRRGLIDSRKNVTVFGPPACGKTLIAEMCMVKEVHRGGKVLYATPYKALDRQKFKDFQTFVKFEFPVLITDGDHPVLHDDLKNTPIVIATYERIFGAVSSGEEWLNDISFVCADEITLLGDDRGATLDSLLTILMTELPSNPRIITLSSHVGNKFDIAKWLQAEAVVEDIYHDIEEYIVFRDDDKIVLWNKTGEITETVTDEFIVEHLVHLANNKDETTLVFVKTRAEAQKIAGMLRKLYIKPFDSIEKKITNRLSSLEERTQLTDELTELLKYGIGFHHAGLPMEMRNLVEDLLEERLVKTVVCTTTLSHGIDYPVDNVIVFLAGLRNRWELDKYVCIQLEGRAGRPGKSQADNISGKGRAYLIVEKGNAEQYMEKYVFGKPEAIMPDTDSDENLSKLVLVLVGISRSQTLRKDEISEIVGNCFATVNVQQKRLAQSVSKILKKLVKYGMLEYRNKQYEITDIGKFINKVNLSPIDANIILNVLLSKNVLKIKIDGRKLGISKANTNEVTDFGLLHLASCIDITKKIRSSIPPIPMNKNKIKFLTIVPPTGEKRSYIETFLKGLVLNDWINEVSLRDISTQYFGYDDYDVYQLGNYAARSLLKISQVAQLLEQDHISKQAEKLAVRCRYGVKTDLANSRLVQLTGIGRVRGRRLFDKGFNLTKLQNSKSSDLKHLLSDERLRKSVITQSKEMTK